MQGQRSAYQLAKAQKQFLCAWLCSSGTALLQETKEMAEARPSCRTWPLPLRRAHCQAVAGHIWDVAFGCVPAAFRKPDAKPDSARPCLRQTVLIRASEDGDIETLTRMASEGAVDVVAFRTAEGDALLHFAARAGCTKAIRHLMGAGALRATPNKARRAARGCPRPWQAAGFPSLLPGGVTQRHPKTDGLRQLHGLPQGVC